MADLDQALARFQQCGFEYGTGVPNYGPMAAAGLVELGHDSLLVGLVDVYAPRLPDMSVGRPIPANERAPARGLRERHGDWLASFEADLAERTWKDVLRSEVPQLIPGLGSASVHGLLRTALAVQVLSREETPIRRRELAYGLAHWAGNFEAGSAAGPVMTGDVRETIQRACVAAATRYLDEPDERAANTVGVTAPAALALLAPHLDDDVLHEALARLASLVPDSPVPVKGPSRADSIDDEEVARCAESPGEISYRAACSLQEHAIPFVAACLRHDPTQTCRVLRTAAADAALRLSPPGYQSWR